jgi:hypothetical protein
MKRSLFTGLMLGLILAGCATSPSHSALPRGAQLVGGGLAINYEVPGDGTVILLERTSGRTVATESITEGQSFTFTPGQDRYYELTYALFGGTNAFDPGVPLVLPTNTFFQLYFVPAKPKHD